MHPIPDEIVFLLTVKHAYGSGSVKKRLRSGVQIKRDNIDVAAYADTVCMGGPDDASKTIMLITKCVNESLFSR